MTPSQIESTIALHSAWSAHMRDTLDELTSLVQQMAHAGAEADVRITAAQERTERTLQRILDMQRPNGH